MRLPASHKRIIGALVCIDIALIFFAWLTRLEWAIITAFTLTVLLIFGMKTFFTPGGVYTPERYLPSLIFTLIFTAVVMWGYWFLGI